MQLEFLVVQEPRFVSGTWMNQGLSLLVCVHGFVFVQLDSANSTPLGVGIGDSCLLLRFL